MQLLKLYLKGGAVAEFTADSFTLTHDGAGAISKLQWTGTIEPELLTWQVDAVSLSTVQVV